ncbi:MAG: hypothetical protein COV76_05635 [Candidatus Omnitrophica bacterium CG11_big_fil_rev_8_21_14_0_20_64_10]|nr:MAG: hypothetical protein COV76_05635 [Candidatus Omnitrophica bacterium CG11_big_fil_rev_8_21_14_0_20_64_10]
MLTHLGGTPDPGQTPDLFGARPARTGGGRDPFGFPESFQNEIRRRHLKATQPQTRPEPETSEQAPLPPLPPIQLQGIFWGIAEPQAIVNRKTVRVGDMVDQAKVVSISREGVRFLYQDHEYLVELPSAAESGPSVGFGQPQGQRVRLR